MGLEDLISRLKAIGVDLYLWEDQVRWTFPAKGLDRRTHLKVDAEIDQNRKELHDKLFRELAKSKARRDEPHLWLARRAAGRKPPLLSCGSPEWCRHFVRTASIFADDEERALWLVLEPKHLLIYRDDFGSWRVSVTSVPEGVEPLVATGVEPLSICDECRPSYEPQATSGDDAVKSGDEDKSAE